MFVKGLIVLGAALLGTVSAQLKGVYQRPTGQGNVTGNTDWWVPNHRSPCPALNTLANHGYLNRNGKGITPAAMKAAVKEVFNVNDEVVNFIVSGFANTFTLADMSKHNLIEHDASLVHADSSYKLDPAQVDGGLANDLFSRVDKDNMLDKNAVAQAFYVRLVWCQQKQGGCDFKSNNRDVTFREGAKLLMIFGSKQNNNRVSAETAYSFLVDERIPDGWKKSQQQISLNELNNLSSELQKMVGVA